MNLRLTNKHNTLTGFLPWLLVGRQFSSLSEPAAERRLAEGSVAACFWPLLDCSGYITTNQKDHVYMYRNLACYTHI